MPATAIIPVKQLVEAKTRLASDLTADDRARLTLAILRRVLDAIAVSTQIGRTLVVTPDAAVAELARAAGAEIIHQEQPGLNQAVRLGRTAVDASGEVILVILGDLPLLSGEELDRLLALVAPGVVVLAPDRHRRGTNVLAIQRDVPFEPAFGVNSLALHRREAQRLGLIVREYRSRGTGFDVDTVEDLQEYQRSQQAMTDG